MAGIDFPAAVISELELGGHAIDRVYEGGRLVGVRLLEAQAAEPTAPRTRRFQWLHRPWGGK